MIKSLNGFTESMQVLYVVDCGKGRLLLNRNTFAQIMSELADKQQERPPGVRLISQPTTV
jgi:hypothetical protein